jgi:hypothetical protein
MTVNDPTGGFGFKRLTVENWLTPDPVWQHFAHPPFADPATAWVQDIMIHDLAPTVPLAVRRLFEVARGSLAYGFLFYPLLTVGTEQISRVLEAAVANRCIALMTSSKDDSFSDRINWLHEAGHFSAAQHRRWHNARKLRNHSSHPKDQSIVDPNMTVEMLRMAVELINELFPA